MADDNTTINPHCRPMAHLIDLFLFKGAPQNHSEDRSVDVLINHGYVCGYSPECFQPLWAAYRVAHADRDVDYDRPHLYYADERLDKSVRLSNRTFGTHDDIQYNVGHLTPNEVINRQFGRLAQMETFFMSNMSPQYASLNSGVWLDLENQIRNIEDTKDARDHMWAIAGPVFGDTPFLIARDGVKVPVPEAYYYVTVDPFNYPWDRESNVDVVCFLIPQTAERRTPLEDFIVDLSVIENKTALTFFPGWNNQIAMGARQLDFHDVGPERRHRLLRQILR